MKKIKVLFITTESLMDHSYTMINELRKYVELDVFFVAKKFTPEIKYFCSKLGAEFFRRKRFINPLGFLAELNLLRAIRKQKADLVWFNTLSLTQALLLRLFVKRPLINAHDIEYHPEEKDYHGIVSQKITFKIFKNSIAVMSRRQAELFKARYGFAPYVMPLPVIDYYEASAEKKAPAEVKPDKIRFLFFGTILPYKGIEILLNAVELLDVKGADYELNIAGKLKYNIGALSAKIKALPNVNHIDEFIDYKDVFNVYSRNNVIIIPYIHVSQCGPLLIGYNQDMPCVTSNQPGFREYVDDGRSGLIFENTAQDLAEKMEMIVNNPAILPEMKKYISENIKSRFSMRSLAPVYAEVFKKHMAGVI